jgi:hypothetical protein
MSRRAIALRNANRDESYKMMLKTEAAGQPERDEEEPDSND